MARLTPAVLRALDILELFLDGATLSASQIVVATGLPRTTVHELLATLVSRDYLQKEGNDFRLGVRLLQLGNVYATRFDLLRAANDVARDLATRTGATINVALREGSEVYYLARVESENRMTLPSGIGRRLPASSTGLGKVLLADLPLRALRELYPDPGALPTLTPNSIRDLGVLEAELEQVRRTGIAFDREEAMEDIVCAAAPVRDVQGKVVAAISASVPKDRWFAEGQGYWENIVLEGAGTLSTQLGFSGAPPK
ncbi:MAG: IclR family transcriptional regulator [Devosia sp.]|nr:IclR family transcriptional regulator [Devosia sp.]